MSKKILNEAFVISKKIDEKGNPIAYIDPNKPENKETFKYKDIFSRHGAKWSSTGRFWFWYIGKTKDQWHNVYQKLIEPALKEVHKLEGALEEESQASLVASLDAVIGEVQAATTGDGEDAMTPDVKKNISDGLQKFKETLVNLDSDEEFKKTMRILTAFRNSQGHQYSFYNTILIWIQNPKASFVMSEIRWNRYNRTVNKDAKKIWVRSPSKNALRPYSKDEKEKIIANFVKSVNKRSYDELSVGEKDRLGVMLRGRFSGNSFDFTPVYDVADTTQMAGKEELLGDYEKKKEIKWYEENMISDEVKPIYNALMNFAQEKGISIELVEPGEMGSARGVSKSGSIGLLKSAGNDVGITKTLAHEITHELLHQKYLHDRDPEMKKFFVGQAEGRDLVEQQAELSAWMIMAQYGFDLKTTSLNYVAIWGANKDDMVKVFDTVTGVVNYMIDYINSQLNKTEISEAVGEIQPARHVTPMDVAKVLGVGGEYQQELKKQHMIERYNKLINK